MERLGQWLETAKVEDIWQQMDDPLQVAMLHGMLFHLQQEIEQLLALGGKETEDTVRVLRTLAFAEQNNGELDRGEQVRTEESRSLNRRTPDAQGGDGAGG
jgi:hypothetical protein